MAGSGMAATTSAATAAPPAPHDHPLFPQLMRTAMALRGCSCDAVDAAVRVPTGARSLLARADPALNKSISSTLKAYQRGIKDQTAAYAAFSAAVDEICGELQGALIAHMSAAAGARDIAAPVASDGPALPVPAAITGKRTRAESAPSQLSATPAAPAGRPRALPGKAMPAEVTNVLMTWFLANMDNPYPSQQEKDMLMRETGLDVTQLRNWLTNQRKRHWKPVKLGRAPRSQLELILQQSNVGSASSASGAH